MNQGPYTIVQVGFLKQCNNFSIDKQETLSNTTTSTTTTKDMATVLGYKRDAIRVKVIKFDGTQESDCRKFSIDPQITSFEVLYSLLAKAFEIKKDFSICYRFVDDYGQVHYLPLLSDYELDAAILNASDPNLLLRIDFIEMVQPPIYEDVAECIQPETSLSLMSFTGNKVPLKLQGLIKNQVEKTFNIFKGALSYMEEQSANLAAGYHPPRSPLTSEELHQFSDHVGQIVQSRELRTVIYYGGIEPSLRKVVWKHILNVYPKGMSGKERLDYTKRKSDEYFKLRDTWKDLLKRGQMVGDLAYVTGMVKKDVLRTDRHHEFYEGGDDNCNVISLYNILTTYALNHPSVSYCQGMSDLASPLLVIMSKEAHAYICFCALMRRLAPNFLIDGIKMTQKFQHLADGLLYYNPTFYEYLKSHQADDLLFCYRWLLLEMKREFAFNDALIMLEVMWSSLPPNPPQHELPLFDKKFEPPADLPPSSPSPSPRENQYTKVCAIRRQTTSSATSSPFKLNTSVDESPLALRRKANASKTEIYANINDTTIISTNGILKSSSDHPFIVNLTSSQSKQQFHDTSSSIPVRSPTSQNIVQKFSQLTKNNIHKSLEKINLQQGAFVAGEYAHHVFNRRGSLKLTTSQAINTTSTKIVKNLNEFLNFSKKVQRNMSLNTELSNETGSVHSPRDKFNKQMSLDERNSKCDENGKEFGENTEPLLEDTEIFVNPKMITQTCSNSTFVQNKAQDKSDKIILKSDDLSIDKSSEEVFITENNHESSRFQCNNNSSSDQDKFKENKKSHLSKTHETDSNESDNNVEKRIEAIEASLHKKIEDIPNYLNDKVKLFSESSPEDDDSSEYFPMTSSITQELKMELENLNRNVFSDKEVPASGEMDEIESGFESNASNTTAASVNNAHAVFADEIFIWENPLGMADSDTVKVATEVSEFGPVGECKTNGFSADLAQSYSTQSFHSNKSSFDSENDVSSASSGTTSGADSIQSSDSTQHVRELAQVINSRSTYRLGLPPPNEFGGGNPFLMFLCITVLCQHSEHIMSKNMDYNEMAIYFDKMIRKHNVHKVLNEARKRYEAYLCSYRQSNRNHQQPHRA